MRILLVIVIFCSQIVFNAQAQRVCGTTSYTQPLNKQFAAITNDFAIANDQFSSASKPVLTNTFRDTSRNEIIYIPVVVHVLYKSIFQNISIDQIQSQIKVLNEDYSHNNKDAVNTPAVFSPLAADTKIRFCLAQVDPQGRKTTGIVRKYTSTDNFDLTDGVKINALGGDNPWDAKRYLNIWVCNLSGRVMGYSSLPGGPLNLDGVVIAYSVFGTVGNVNAPFNKGRTATHEIGHWLGLKHIWGDAVCGSDGIDDTPTQQYFNYGCPTFPHISNCSPNVDGDLFMNFMDFTNDACMNLFTVGQKQRMRSLFAKNNFRNSFLLSFACDSTLAQGGALPDAAADTSAPKTKNINVFPVKYFMALIYPNPVIANFNVELKNGSIANKKSISIFTVSGFKVFTAPLNADKTIINATFLPRGIYLVCITDGNNKITLKMVKQ